MANGAGADAPDPIVSAALERGYLSHEQLDTAVRLEHTLAAEGRSPGLRALLAQRFLRPEHVDALRQSITSSSTNPKSGGYFRPSPTARLASRELVPGATIGDFVIDRALGRGGMGAVFAGHDPRNGQQVAIKVLLDLDDKKALERFRREGVAQASADSHPNVLRVLAAGEHDGSPFLAMELAEGEDLSKRLAKGPLPPREAARIVAGLGRGLAHVHARGILHRDLKPANVLFGEDGTPKLVDFGVAHLYGEQALTRTGDLVGTPAYMAPEQAEGARHAMDERTDVYGLGAIFYQSVTGQPPFQAEGMTSLLRKVLDEPITPPSKVVPGLPADVDRVAVTALAKLPEDRYASATLFADDLDRLARGEPVLGRDVAGARRRGRRRLSAGVGLAGAVALAALVAAVWRTWPTSATGPDAVVVTATPPAGTLRAVHGKALTRLGWLTVEAAVSGDLLAARVTVGDTVAAASSASGWTFEGRVPLALGPNVVKLEAQRVDDARWVVLADLRVERDRRFEVAPPDVVFDRQRRRVLLDEAREEYVAHDGSVLVYVPPGKFRRGCEEIQYRAVMGMETEMAKIASPEHQVTLTRGLLIGKHEVSWGQLEAFFAAGAAPRRGRPTPAWTDAQPAVDVTWTEAKAYCAWAGLELPTEAQWEWAARGPESRAYPWGDEMDELRVRLQPAREPCAVGDTTFDGASWVGALHMCGNVWEWVEDTFTPTYDPVIALHGTVDPCNRGDADAPPETYHVVRGGGWRGSPRAAPKEGTPRCHTAYRWPERGTLTYDAGGGRMLLNAKQDIGLRPVLTLDDAALGPP
jgi:formylglycine-generating enzyme required for sulfatase activity